MLWEGEGVFVCVFTSVDACVYVLCLAVYVYVLCLGVYVCIYACKRVYVYTFVCKYICV